MIRKSLILFVLVTSLWSCSKKDDEVQPIADFTITVNGQAPSATLTIVNKSTDATTYAWTFSEGASIASATDKEPSGIKVDKTGELSVTLVANNGALTNSKTIKVNVTGNNAIVSYSDIEFSLTAGNSSYGRLFSFETGKIYKDNEVNATIGPKIHLAFGSMGNTMYYFESPTKASYGVTGATVTKVTNWLSSNPITITTFDAMVDASELNGLTINETNESFGNSSIPGIVLFQLASGRKGAIKTKAVNSSRLLVDIKIQKY